MAQQRLGQYEILDRIGKGGMGVVYRARDTQLGRQVAIKILPPEVSSDPERRSRFLREAQAAANLNHPNIATVYQFGTAAVDDPEFATPLGREDRPEVLFLAMELVDGQDLQSLIHQHRDRGPMSVQRALKIGLDTLQGLEAAHRSGVVHRDLKPNNIRVTTRGEVKILDFGLAKFRQRVAREAHGEGDVGSDGDERSQQPTLLASFQTTQSMLLGTPPYMAPEQLRSPDVDGRCDLFALGVVLYQMLAGRTPYEGRHLIDYVKALAKGSPQPLNEVRDDVPKDLAEVVARLLEHEPDHRYSSAQEAIDALEQAAGMGPATAPTRIQHRPAGSARGWRWIGPRAWIAAGLLAAILVILAFLPFGSSPAGPLTVEVQPFDNRTGAPELTRCLKSLEVYLASELPGLSGVRVVDRAAARGEAQGANVLMRGTLILVGDTPRTNLQFLDSDTGSQIVSLAYDGDCRTLQGQLPDIALTSSVLLQVCAETGARGCTEAESVLDAGMRRLGLLVSPNDTEGAQRLFHLALRMDPEYALAYAARSIVHQNRYELTPNEELLDNARQDAQRAVELGPDNAMAHYALGRLQRLLGNTDRALEHLHRGVAKLEPSDAEGQFRLEISAAQGQAGDWEGARKTLLQVLEQWPENWWYHNQLGGVEYQLGDYEQARRHWRQAAELATEQESGWPLGNLALLAYQVDGDVDEALEIYQRIPDFAIDADTAAARAFVLYSDERFEAAALSYQRAIELQPNDPSLYADLGDTYARLRQVDASQRAYEEALRLVKEQLRLTPDKTDLEARLPLYLAKVNRCEDGLREADRLVASHASPRPEREIWLRVAQTRALCQRPGAAAEAVLRLVDEGEDPCRLLLMDELTPLRVVPTLVEGLAQRGRPLEACTAP